jgi:cytolysin-activating lysine-acyltransferase
MLSKDIEEEMIKGRRKLKPHEWRTGDQPWLIDLIAPFGGGDEFLVHLRDKVFADVVLKTIVPGEVPGTTDVVSLKRGTK